MRQKAYPGGKPFRKRFGERFSLRAYGRRKLGERPFDDLEVRGSTCRYRKRGHRYKGALLLACEHNLRAWFRNKAWSDLFRILEPSKKLPPG